jgi:uncharacterized protein YndB with AHSA1/START domain
MTSNNGGGNRIVGSLRAADDKGVVRMEDRYATNVGDLWSALTERPRLARWLGDFDGDLRLGGQFSARFFASGWEGTGQVVACEPPRRLLVTTTSPGPDGPEQHEIEATLTPDGSQTLLVLEERGMPLGLLPEYGAGIQVHVEDLAAYLAGRDRCAAEARWGELLPDYQALAADVS